MKITSETKIKEIIDKKELFEILISHGFPCISCPISRMEMDVLDIGSVCEMYGINEIQLLEDINAIITKKRKKI